MGVLVDMRVTELLCSRLCHDLVGPVGAVNHGIELIEDENSPLMAEATQMMSQSAQQASNRLEFFRLAFGLSGGGTGTISLQQGRALATGYLDKNVQLSWPLNPDLPWRDDENQVPKDLVKVILNMIMMAVDCLPRGGQMALDLAHLPEGLGVALVCEGKNAQIRDDIQNVLLPHATCDSLTARTVQAFFFARLADDLGVDFESFSPRQDCLQFAAIIPIGF